MNSRNSKHDRTSGQGVWLFLTILTFILFAVSITFVVMDIQANHDDGLWPVDESKSMFYKRTKNGIDPVPPSIALTPAPAGAAVAPEALPEPVAPEGDATNGAPVAVPAP